IFSWLERSKTGRKLNGKRETGTDRWGDASGWGILIALKGDVSKELCQGKFGVSSGDSSVHPKVVHRPDSGFAGIPDLSVFEAGE
ncbi:MAG: hypothetical protein ACTHMT_12705, partial [Verrucomicrobiota bacterium]